MPFSADMDETPALTGNIQRHVAASRTWDVIVVGAGLAGSMAAIVSARQGLETLLIDRGIFPRDKVCGGCLNMAALAELAAENLSDLPWREGGVALKYFRLATPGAEARIDLPGGVAISRRSLDSALIRHAVSQGVSFLPATAATSGGLASGVHYVDLGQGNDSHRARARWVIAADGLSGAFSRSLPDLTVAQPGSPYIGLSADSAISPEYAANTIHMACHREGYAGLVTLGDGGLHMAAAVNARWLKSLDRPAEALKQILTANRWPVPENMTALRVHGTPRLRTTRRPVAQDRVFLVGDAAGYIEPFTGEGMAWALKCGRTAALQLPSALAHGSSRAVQRDWSRAYTELIEPRQKWCTLAADFLRHPHSLHWGVRMLALAPILARPIVRALNHTGNTAPLPSAPCP